MEELQGRGNKGTGCISMDAEHCMTMFETPEGKTMENEIKKNMYGMQNQVMNLVKLAVPASYLCQIIYMGHRYISVVDAAVGLRQRYNLERVGDVDMVP